MEKRVVLKHATNKRSKALAKDNWIRRIISKTRRSINKRGKKNATIIQKNMESLIPY
jgi:hypothetical protein